jgi:hypothetical protein
MKQKMIISLVLVALILAPFMSEAKWPDKEKIKNGIIGSWAFNRFWGVWQSEPVKKSEDPADIYSIYTFYENGKVRIWSSDQEKYRVEHKIFTWGLIPVKSSEGTLGFAIKLVDSSIDPANQTEIEGATGEYIFVVTGVSKKNMWWIKSSPDVNFSEKEYFTEFSKVNVAAPTN